MKDKEKKDKGKKEKGSRERSKSGIKALRSFMSPDKKVKPKSTLKVVDTLIAHLERTALDLEGLCRVSGNAHKVKDLKQKLENEEPVNLDEIDDLHVVSGALKLIFREMPEPLLTFSLYQNFLAAHEIPDRKARVAFLKSLVTTLPPDNAALFKALLKFLYNVQRHAEANKMHSANLAIIFAPTLLRAKEETVESMMSDASAANETIKSLIEAYPVLCPDESQSPILYSLSIAEDKPAPDARSQKDVLDDALARLDAALKACDEEASARAVWESYSQSLELKLQAMTDECALMVRERDEAEAGTDDWQRALKEELVASQQAVEQLTSVNNSLRESDESHREQISTLNNRLIEAESTAQKLQEEVRMLERVKEDGDATKVLHDEVAELRRASMNVTLATQKAKVADDAAIAQLQQQVSSLKKSMSELESSRSQEKIQSETQIKKLQDELSASKKTIAESTSAQNKLKADLQERTKQNQQQVAVLARNVSDAEQLLQQFKEQSAAAHKQLLDDKNALEASAQVAAKEKSALQASKDQLSAENQKLCERVKEIQASAAQHASSATEHDHALTKLQDEINMSRAAEARLEQDNKSMEQDNKRLEQETKRLEQDNKRLEQETKRIEQDNKRLEQETKRLEQDNKRIEQETKRLEQDNKRLEQETKRLDQDSKRIDQDTKRLEQDNKRIEQESKRHEQDNKRLEQDNKRLEQDNKRLEQDNKQLKADVAALSETLSAGASATAAHDLASKGLQDEVAKLKSQIASREIQIQKLRGDLSDELSNKVEREIKLKKLEEQIMLLQKETLESNRQAESHKTNALASDAAQQKLSQDVLSLKERLFMWICLAMKLNLASHNKICNVGNADLWEEIQVKSIQYSEWPAFISSSMELTVAPPV